MIYFGMMLMLFPPGSWTFKVNQRRLCFSLKCYGINCRSSAADLEESFSCLFNGLQWSWKRSFANHCILLSLCSEQKWCVHSMQHSVLLDISKGASIITRKFWEVAWNTVLECLCFLVCFFFQCNLRNFLFLTHWLNKKLLTLPWISGWFYSTKSAWC